MKPQEHFLYWNQRNVEKRVEQDNTQKTDMSLFPVLGADKKTDIAAHKHRSFARKIIYLIRIFAQMKRNTALIGKWKPETSGKKLRRNEFQLNNRFD